MSASFPTQDHHMYSICSNVIFLILFLSSRPMASHHMISHVTLMSHASLLSQRKEKENQYKIRKIKEKKNKNY